MLHLQHNKVMLHSPSLKNSFNKTLKVIESCTTKEQLNGALNMINNFKQFYKAKMPFRKTFEYIYINKKKL